MNDRTSAAPPVHFLDAAQRAALECPAMRSQPRPVSDDWADKQVKKNRLLGQVWDGVRGRLGFKTDERGSRRRDKSRRGDREENRSSEEHKPKQKHKLREEHKSMEKEVEDTTRREEQTREEKPEDEQKVERPTREEILANYHHLVASGFFSSHAIQSTRQPAPGATTASTSSTASAPSKSSLAPTPRAPTPQNLSRAPTPQNTSRAPTPQLQASAAPHRPSSPFKPKFTSRQHSDREGPRAATYDELVASGFFSPPAPLAEQPSPSDVAPAPTVSMGRTSRDYLHPPNFSRPSRSTTPAASRPASPIQSPASADSRGTKRAVADSTSDDEDEDSARDPPTPKKKLRKSASRDIAIPKLRNAPSHKAILSRRSVSGPHGLGKEYNNLARRVLGRLPGGNARSSADMPDRRTEAPARRSTDERPALQETHSTRVLRPCRSAAEHLSVGPNANRGIPKVPVIPEKFASFDENRENPTPPVSMHR